MVPLPKEDREIGFVVQQTASALLPGDGYLQFPGA